jgi:hypothetical protein
MKPHLLAVASLLAAALSLPLGAAGSSDSEIQRELRGYHLIRQIEGVAEHADNGSSLGLYRGVTQDRHRTRVLNFEIWKSSEIFVERYFFTSGRLTRVRTLTFPYAYDYKRQQLDPAQARLSRSELVDLTERGSQRKRLILEIDQRGESKRFVEAVSPQQIEKIKVEFRRLNARLARSY